MPLIVEVNADVFITEKNMDEDAQEMDVYGKALFAEDDGNDIILFFPECDLARFGSVQVGSAYTVRGMASLFAEENNLVSIQFLEPDMIPLDPENFTGDDRKELRTEIARLRAVYCPTALAGEVTH